MKKKRKSVRLSLTAWIGLGLAVVLFVFNGYTAAKYIMKEKEDQLYTAKAFYFSSDYLKNDTGTGYPTYELQDGIDSVDIVLRNYDDALRSSEMDIEYQIMVNKDQMEVETLATDQGSVTKKITLQLPESAGTAEYLVEATVLSPYSKSIGAYFIVTKPLQTLTVTKAGSLGYPVLKLTVATNAYSGPVCLSWPERVYPDMTDPLLASATYSDSERSCVLDLPSDSEYIFTFLTDDLSKNLKDELEAEIASNQ